MVPPGKAARSAVRPVFLHEESHMFDGKLDVKKVAAAMLAMTLLFGTAACGDEAGEDEIGDGEIDD